MKDYPRLELSDTDRYKGEPIGALFFVASENSAPEWLSKGNWMPLEMALRQADERDLPLFVTDAAHPNGYLWTEEE